MNEKQLTKEIFLKEVSSHSIEIIKDDGLYRHIKCSNNGSYNQSFEIITWPGCLAYNGDMGSFMFSRIDDMFSFFRNDKQDINTSYWAEKVVAESVFGNGIRKFSVEQFRECVLEDVRYWLNIEESDTIPCDIMEEIEPLLDADDKYECVTAIRDFNSDKVKFYDFWEHSCNRKTWHFIWCCYAIVWAINKYDEAKSTT